MLLRTVRGIARPASRLALATRAYSDQISVMSIYQEMVEFMRKKGHIGKTDTDIALSVEQFDEIMLKDPEVRQMYDKAQRQMDYAIHHSGLRTRERSASRPPVRVAVTGAAGAIGYAALFRIASGQMLGLDQPVHLQLLELPAAKQALEGVVMELQDCAFPLVSSISISDDPVKAFDGADYALLIGAKPRTKGMERSDLLKANADIFKVQGEALNKAANRDTLRVVVVGNPANTNAWIAAQSAKDISPTQFTAMTRLDHDRGLGQLSLKTGAPVNHIERFCIWGNHSSTMVPDINNVVINDKWGRDVINDNKWVEEKFTPTVQNRGAQIIAARGASSAASAANAAIKHMHDWALGTNGRWTSMAVWSDGSYGAEPGIYYSYPVVCVDGNYTIVQNVPIDPATAKKMEASNQELIAERDAVAAAMGIKKPAMKDTFNHWKAQFDKNGTLPFYYPPLGPPKGASKKA